LKSSVDEIRSQRRCFGTSARSNTVAPRARASATATASTSRPLPLSPPDGHAESDAPTHRTPSPTRGASSSKSFILRRLHGASTFC